MSAYLTDIEDDLKRMERQRLAPPRERAARRPFASLSAQNQRSVIRDHVRKVKCDESLIFEALSQHELADKFLAAFFVGDVDQLGTLADRIIRDYLQPHVEMEWSLEDDQ